MPEPRKYGGQTAEQRASDRRERLVRATIALLGARGESGTTMTAICAESGVTERYFYESFRHRDAALVAALDTACNRIADVALAAFRAAGSEVGLAAAVTAVVDLMAAEPDLARVATVEATANAALRSHRHELVGWFAGLVADEVSPPGGSRTRARLHATVFVAGFAELVALWLLRSGGVTREQVIAVGIDLLSRAVDQTHDDPGAG